MSLASLPSPPAQLPHTPLPDLTPIFEDVRESVLPVRRLFRKD
jgi:hypothetical protein